MMIKEIIEDMERAEEISLQKEFKEAMEKRGFTDTSEITKECRDIVEILKKSYKYRWHDLRKNPEDLPDTPRLVLTKIDFENWEYEISRYMQFECTSMWMNQKAQPIAWREIEPFEEEE